jgi:hypothetical protein
MAGPYSGTAGSVVLISGGTTRLGNITEWNLTMERTTVETTSFGLDATTIIPAIKTNSGSFTGNWDNADTGQTGFYDAYESGSYLRLRLHFGAGGSINYWDIGSALITGVNATTSVTGKAEISYDFEVNGTVGLVD